MKTVMANYFIRNLKFSDINPVDAGFEKCAPEHSHGYCIRGYYLIHYIVSGKGILLKDGKEYRIGAGKAFLIKPGDSTKYIADKNNPWEYIWIGFDGKTADMLNDFEATVFEPDIRIFEKVKSSINYTNMREIYLKSCICELLCDMYEKNTAVDPVEKIKNYIDIHYMENPKIEDIAKTVLLNRKYLVRLFKKKTNHTIQEYIVSRKMKAAKKFLKSGYNVNEVSQLTGYSDQSTFSRAFKNYYNIPPSDTK